eukprot:CAMPEP_0176403792 /NCGR_PEP_ID=MMETSP0126-20121128/50375_1 /TAXON_ID=141414 ORGANISM="Strombidinopsis acuminatum, Strain SPMC142" /NCGR_SAMPLE_ID=MMETSP0126 /ASSEMBLY_ACC=CAM_ASM_000229 /LENGTH=45 /DNA_ID= /DNA_START= /DNA_END= /DNA_ORIENTATION=
MEDKFDSLDDGTEAKTFGEGGDEDQYKEPEFINEWKFVDGNTMMD